MPQVAQPTAPLPPAPAVEAAAACPTHDQAMISCSSSSRPVSPLGGVGPVRRRSLRAAVVALALAAAALLGLAPGAGAAVSFSGPTNFAAGDAPESVAVGDFNADGDPDLAVANFNSGNVSVLLGQAGGAFSAPASFAAGSGPFSVAGRGLQRRR